MIEQVERKIEELEKLKNERYYKKKEADLIAWGLTSQSRGKKVVPIIVTDEEYEALKEAAKGTDQASGNRTRIGQIMTFIGIAIAIIGLIAGVAMYLIVEDLSLFVLTGCWGGSLALCCLFLGIAEIINLVNRMSNDM